MNTQKGNKLIAEFMGELNDLHPNTQEDLKNGIITIDENLHPYHKSWDWLMPVVEKLFGILYKEKSSHPRFYDTIKYIQDHLIQGHIGKVWETCVWCIQWYNEQQTPYKSQKESPYLYKCEVRHA